MSGAPLLWPVVCCGCHARYAAFRVYARWGARLLEWPMCSDCGPNIPAHALDADDIRRMDGQWHTILRPVPDVYDPRLNPYPVSVKETAV